VAKRRVRGWSAPVVAAWRGQSELGQDRVGRRRGQSRPATGRRAEQASAVQCVRLGGGEHPLLRQRRGPLRAPRPGGSRRQPAGRQAPALTPPRPGGQSQSACGGGAPFCLEDRALLCRSCDVAMHTANALVSAHRRFLLLPGIAGAVASPAGEERPGAPIHDV